MNGNLMHVLRQRGLGGRVFFITGPSGVGKTTIARLIAKELTLPYAIYEMDAQRMSLADVREFDRMCHCKPLGGSYHVWIINEAHNMSSKVVSELQTVLESPHVQRNSTWAFTTTSRGEKLLFDSKFDAVPFLSRAIKIELDGAARRLTLPSGHGRSLKPRDSMANRSTIISSWSATARAISALY